MARKPRRSNEGGRGQGQRQKRSKGRRQERGEKEKAGRGCKFEALCLQKKDVSKFDTKGKTKNNTKKQNNKMTALAGVYIDFVLLILSATGHC
jgi:hypothetical protein